jgi:hypothetical protein
VAIDSDRIADAHNADILHIAQRCGARLMCIAAAEWAGPCPRCGGVDRFSINVRKRLFNCRRAGGGDPIALAQHALGLNFPDAIDFILGSSSPRARAEPKPELAKDDAEDRVKLALRIWDAAVDPRGTPVSSYLANRGVPLPDEAAHDAIRYHPACPFARTTTPAMVALVRDIISNEPCGVHRTAITLDGQKSLAFKDAKMSLGRVAAGCVKLTPDEHVALCLGIGEGIESTLSIRQIEEFGPSPVWSVLNANGMASFPVLPAVKSLWIAVDADKAGVDAANAVAARWRQGGLEVVLIKPRVDGDDLNDLAQRAA